jgi:hypothetical protein
METNYSLFTLLRLLNCCERRGNVCFHCCDALPVAGQVAGCGVAPTGMCSDVTMVSSLFVVHYSVNVSKQYSALCKQCIQTNDSSLIHV